MTTPAQKEIQNRIVELGEGDPDEGEELDFVEHMAAMDAAIRAVQEIITDEMYTTMELGRDELKYADRTIDEAANLSALLVRVKPWFRRLDDLHEALDKMAEEMQAMAVEYTTIQERQLIS